MHPTELNIDSKQRNSQQNVLFSLGYFWSRAPKSLLKYMAPIWRPISVVIPWLSRSSAPQISPDPKWLPRCPLRRLHETRLGSGGSTSLGHGQTVAAQPHCLGRGIYTRPNLITVCAGNDGESILGMRYRFVHFSPIHKQLHHGFAQEMSLGDLRSEKHGARTKNNETAMDCHGES